MRDEVATLEYNDATMEYRGAMVPIKLKMTNDEIYYRISKTGKHRQLSLNDVSVVNWQRLAGGYGVRIFTKDGNLYRFGGFKDGDQGKFEKYFRNTCNKTMTEKEFSVKGWNYGAAKFEGGVMAFEVAGVPSFEIPLCNVSGCTTGKNEVTMEFHQNEDAPVSLVEMRFHIPPSELAGDDPVESFQMKVMSRASIVTATGDAMVTFSQIQCLTPRGRYDIKIYPTFIQLHGKTFDFKIQTHSVLRLFLLPHLDGRQHFFVVSLDPPIKQGQTRYPFLILLFFNEDDDTVELQLSEDELQDKFQGRLKKEYSGPQYEVISRLYKGLCNKKIVSPGTFLGHSGSPAISCSNKATAGYLYPLERGFIYIPKPPIYIKLEDISYINFARSGSTTRSFDFEVGCENKTVHTFNSIDKGEYGKLHDFVKAKKLKIKDSGKGTVSHKEAFGESDKDVNDPYMRRVKEEAREHDDEDDGSEEDSDFNPGEEGSDVAEEFDSNAGDSSDNSGSNSNDEGKAKKNKEAKPKKAKTVSEKPRKRKPKKEVDANKPKRPMSSYFLWLNENREKIKKDNPGISITDVSKKAGVLWKELKDRTKWDEQAIEVKKKYEIAMKEYKSSETSSKMNSSSSKKAKTTSSASPSKAGSGGGFKSKEYIEDSDSSSANSDDQPLDKIKASDSKKKTDNSDVDMESDISTPAESD